MNIILIKTCDDVKEAGRTRRNLRNLEELGENG